ncbi:hypothetical protein AB0O04_37130, partial [Streptomyces althioticus]|uniref:hypothetical protein n=1 Tax=Streptomyces althioticus TaxID=83380 RepID=UPI003445CFFE
EGEGFSAGGLQGRHDVMVRCAEYLEVLHGAVSFRQLEVAGLRAGVTGFQAAHAGRWRMSAE